jgi:diamine N-acetyltransferase
MGMNWTIRQARAADAMKLSELAERTFRDAFSSLNTEENMNLHCATAFSSEIQLGEITNPDILTLVAESGDELVAFAQVHLRGDMPDCIAFSPAVELHRIYVQQNFHGAGLARDLLAEVMETAKHRGAAAVWLGVWEQNPRAIRFYQRSGFTEVGDHVFVVGTDPQRDLVMVRECSG